MHSASLWPHFSPLDFDNANTEEARPGDVTRKLAQTSDQTDEGPRPRQEWSREPCDRALGAGRGRQVENQTLVT